MTHPRGAFAVAAFVLGLARRLHRLGATTSGAALVSYRDSGYFSPDVQQQVVGNVLLIWLLITAAVTSRRRHADPVR